MTTASLLIWHSIANHVHRLVFPEISAIKRQNRAIILTKTTEYKST